MKEDAIFRRLEDFSLRHFVDECRKSGRLKIPATLRREAAQLHEFTLRTRRSDEFRSFELDSTLDLTERFLSTESYLTRNGYANYPAYLFTRVLSWALGVSQRCSYVSQWNRARGALRTLAADLLAYEQKAVATGFKVGQLATPELGQKRLHLIQTFLDKVPEFPQRITHTQEEPQTWADYALNPRRGRALEDLICLPLTTEHDEYLFIRVLQMGECCFWGALAGVMAAIERGKLQQWKESVRALETALYFSELLVPLMDILKTMPTEHFWQFREETDGSSAIQSRSYQMLQIYTLGVDDRKAATLAGIPEISDLVLYADPRFYDLRRFLRHVRDTTPEALEVLEPVVAKLDKSLFVYRAVHLAVARKYVPAHAHGGTGGTGGIPYLTTHVQRRLLPIDPEFPLDQPPLPELPEFQPVYSDVG